MGHHCQYQSVIKVDSGKITRIVMAIWKDKALEVMYQHLNEDIYIRNIDYSYCGGYTVAFPNETIKSYYYGYGRIQELEEWYKTPLKCNLYDDIQSIDYEAIYQVEPKLYYFFKKLPNHMNRNSTDLFELMETYLNHPESEYLIEYGLLRLATNKNLYTLTKAKKTQIMKFVKEHLKELDNATTLNMIQTAVNNKIDLKTAIELLDNKCHSLKEYEYKKNMTYADKELYSDYLKLAKKFKVNLKDDYWKFPKDLRGKHNELVQKGEAEKQALEKAYWVDLAKRVKKYKKLNKQIDKYKIFVSSDRQEWIKQADTLHQCIIQCEYFKKKDSVIVFIYKNGKPEATAQINKKKEILQFYRNERDRDNCQPTQRLKDVFNSWLKTFEIERGKIKLCQN